MITVTCQSIEESQTLAKRALFFAYNASVVVGMGALQQRANVSEDDVFSNVFGRGDYPFKIGSDNISGLYADYVFGRMMKMNLKLEDKTIVINNDMVKKDYQSWCGVYKSYKSLFMAAAKELNMTIVIE